MSEGGDGAEADDYEEPWWGPMGPDFIVIGTGGRETSAMFTQFADQLTNDLWSQSNRPTLGVPLSAIPAIDELPDDVFGVLTNDAEVLAWSRRRGVPAVYWREVPTKGFELSIENSEESSELFQSTDMHAAVRRASEILQALRWPEPGSLAEDSGNVGVTPTEHQRLEVVISGAYEVVEHHSLDLETRALLRAAIETMEIQLRTSQPDRTIVGRALNRVGLYAGGLMTGVAANYLYSLLPHFRL